MDVLSRATNATAYAIRNRTGNQAGPTFPSYGWALLLVAAATVLAYLTNLTELHIPYLLFFVVATALATRLFGIKPGILAIVVSGTVIDFFFVTPIYSLIPDFQEIPRLAIFLVCAFLIGLLSKPSGETVQLPVKFSEIAQDGTQAPQRAATRIGPVDSEKAMPIELTADQLRSLRSKKILVMGLPGSGKTTLANVLVSRLNAVHFNGDEVRANIHRDLKFSHEDRVENARRMGWLCDHVVATGNYAIADFICPTEVTRQAFGDAFIVWVDRADRSRYADTDAMFEPPSRYDMRVTATGSPHYWAEQICEHLLPQFNPKNPTALFLGRYQPFHDGHKALIEEGLKRVGQACVAVRDTTGIDQKNPLEFHAVKARIESALWPYRGRIMVVQVPNITNIFYGRDVGYTIERLMLGESLESISATMLRSELAAPPEKPAQ